MELKEVKEMLNNINFAEYSCLDMNYLFEVKEENSLFLIRASFQRKDINTGELGTGWGCWHTTPVDDATETSIVMTVWVCIKMIVEHELLEGFTYLKKKVFNPHKTVQELVYPETLK